MSPERDTDERSTTGGLDARHSVGGGTRPLRSDGGVDLSPEYEGEHVVGEEGRGVGVVTEVDADEGRLRVEPNPDLVDGLKAKLGWTDADGEGRWVDADTVVGTDGDRIVVRASAAETATPEDPVGREGPDAADATDADAADADANATPDTGAGAEGSTTGRIDVADEDEGKEVVTAEGEAVGVVTDADSETGRLTVDPDPDLTDRVRAGLGWRDAAEAPHELGVDAVESVEGSRIVVASADAAERIGDDAEPTTDGAERAANDDGRAR